MIIRKSLAASGYIVSLSGAGAACWYLAQPRTIGEAITKIDTLSSTQEHFVNTWRLFKDDDNFMNWVIGAGHYLNYSSPTLENDAAEIIKEYCKEVTEFPLVEINVKTLLPKALTWCTVPKKQAKVNVAIGDSASWSEITESMEDKEIKPDDKTFLVAIDYTDRKRGLQRQTFYCWNKETNNWDIKKEGALCN